MPGSARIRSGSPSPRARRSRSCRPSSRRWSYAGEGGAEANGKAHGPKLAEQLQKQGFKVGPKGWALRVSHAVADSGDSLTMGRASLPIPKVVYTWELLDESGQLVWQGKSDGRFPAYSSKYATQAPPAQTTNPLDQSRHFNFGGRDIRGAIVEEIFEVGAGLTVPGILPKSLLKVGDTYPKYPVSNQFRAGKAP